MHPMAQQTSAAGFTGSPLAGNLPGGGLRYGVQAQPTHYSHTLPSSAGGGALGVGTTSRNIAVGQYPVKGFYTGPHDTTGHKHYYTTTTAHSTPAVVARTEPVKSYKDSPKKRTKDKSHSRRKKPKKKSTWQSVLCLDAWTEGKNAKCSTKNFTYRPNFCSGDNTTGQKSRSRGISSSGGVDQIKIYDGSYIPVDLADDLSEDWDLMKNARSTSRKGPENRRSSTDLQIQMRDLFPCMGDIFDFLGCSKKKKTRARIEQRSAPSHKHPQLETVCLECGHILDQKTLGKTVLRDAGAHIRGLGMAPRHPKGILPASDRPAPLFDYGYGEVRRDWEKESAYSKYKGWEYEEDEMYVSDGDEYDGAFGGSSPGRHRRRSADRIPLPQFRVDEPRKFRFRPGAREHRPANNQKDYFDLDDTGHIALPQFAFG